MKNDGKEENLPGEATSFILLKMKHLCQLKHDCFIPPLRAL
jgi:hypothetical protein